MIEATIYDLATGEIAYPVSLLNEDEVRQNIGDGQGYILGKHDGKTTRIVDGQPVPIPQEELDELEVALAWDMLRANRDRRLASSDWTQVPDAPVDSAAWAVYRQALRDLPANTTDPRDPAWPIPPA